MKNKKPSAAQYRACSIAAFVFCALLAVFVIAAIFTVPVAGVPLFIVWLLLLYGGFLWWKEAGKAKRVAKESQNNSPALRESSQPHTDHDDANRVTIPARIGDSVLLYRYENVALDGINYELLLQRAQSNQWKLDAGSEDGTAQIYSLGEKIGRISSKKISDMLCDWMDRGDQFRIYLQNLNTELKQATAYIAFYKPLSSITDGRECEVIKLVGCGSLECQTVLSTMSPGDVCELSDDYDLNGDPVIFVSSGADVGKLPAAAARKYASDGAAICLIDRIEYDDTSGKYVPYVKIYW